MGSGAGAGGAGGSGGFASPVRTASSAGLDPGAPVELLKPAVIRREMEKVVDDVAGVLDLPRECASTLLRHFRWEKERLYDTYYADPERTRAKAGIAGLGVSAAPTGPFECEVCFDEVGPSEGFSLGCKHTFCRTCWRDFFSVVVREGPSCVFSRCMMNDCNEAVTEATVAAMARKEDAVVYDQHVLRQFVHIAKSMAWCPAPDCPNAFVSRGYVGDVVCECGMKFCFRCGSEAHQPVDCVMLEKWLEKCNNESETANWILANTKKCPKCSVRIEKNQGCNHMTCRNSGCRYEFCWICMGSWEEHGPKTGGFYTCNRYDPKDTGTKSEGKRDKAAEAKRELDRYLHYYRRYAGHDEAGRFATKLRSKTRSRIRAIQEKSSGEWVDAEFLASAAEVVIECRRVLKYTYVLCYYLDDGPEKTLLEHQQEMLEHHTEALAELTEKDSVCNSDRAEVTNYTRVTQTFVKGIIGGVDGGMDESGLVLAGAGGAGGSSSAAAAAGAASGGRAMKRRR